MDSAFTHAVFRQGATALITGAASGIGLALAKRCYSCQMNLILLDKRDDGLQQALQQFPSTETITTTAHSIDVSSIDSWRSLALASSPTRVIGKTPNTSKKTFAINTLGYTNGIVAILDMVKGSNEARIIILTGSKQGIINPPSDPAYNASHATVRTIAEHPLFDTVKAALNVSLHLLVPGWTYTGVHTAAFKDNPVGACTSEQMIDFMIQKMAEGKAYIMCLENEVSKELDRKRFTWTTNALLEVRLPLSRWREEWAGKAKKTMNGE